MCPILLAGDWNQKLDQISDSEIIPNEMCLKSFIQAFDLCDFYQISKHDFSKNDKIRLERQGQIPCVNSLGNTFYPKIPGHRPSRIDGIFVSYYLFWTEILRKNYPEAKITNHKFIFQFKRCCIQIMFSLLQCIDTIFS